MSSPRPHEQVLLEQTERLVQRTLATLGVSSEPPRLELLEAAASRLGGWDLKMFRTRFPQSYEINTLSVIAAADAIVEELRRTPVPPALALCSLARPMMTHTDRRAAGVYYTDFRLAEYVAGSLHFTEPFNVIDPACGTGVLLVRDGLSCVCIESSQGRRSHPGLCLRSRLKR